MSATKMPDSLAGSDKDKKMKSLKRQMENWREFLVGLYSILVWNEPWYPALVVGMITLVFLAHWYINPPFFATISLLLLTVSLLDVLIPKMVHFLYPPQQWTASKEKTYELICEAVVKIQDAVSGFKSYLSSLKSTQPNTYAIGMVSGCITMTWLSFSINNLVLFYILVTILALYPGMKHNKIIDKCAFKIFSNLSDRLRTLNDQEKLKTS